MTSRERVLTALARRPTDRVPRDFWIEQPALRNAHGAAGEQRSIEFSWDRINQVVADTYVRLIRQHGVPRP